MDQQNPTLAKIPILDIGKFEQWQFRIQQYLQHEHYALWEVIEFGDSYEVPASAATTDTTRGGTGKKSGRTITLIAEDLQKRKNDVKTRTTLLLSLPDEHQLRFTEGSETLEQTFNRLQVIIGQLQFMDVEIEQDDLNQKFLTSLAPEWLIHTIVWKNRSDLDTISLDDLYNHLKVYESEVQKKSEPNSQNMAFISSAKYSRGNEDVTTASVSTASTNISTTSTNVGITKDSIPQSLCCITKRITFNPHLTFTLNSQQEMDQQYPTVAKIPVLDTRKFKQWQFWIQQYLQHEHYAMWEVIEFRDSYTVPASSSSTTTTDTTSDESGSKSGRTVTLTVEDMQKKKNNVKARTTLLLSLPDEHQLRFSKYKTAQELWAAILKTFGGNEATKKTKKNLLNKYKTAQELWAAILKTFSGNEVTKKTKKNLLKQQYVNFKAEGSETLEQTFNRLQVIVGQLQFMDKKTGKKISIQGSNVAGFDKSKVECFNCHKMGHFARECRAPRSQDRGRRDNYRQGSKVEEHALKALMTIDGVRWDWSYMANDEEDHALVADEEASTEFALMANTSPESKVFDNSLCSTD
nr:hypothetical protein [Tanacetum cinerariifolium]